MEKWWRQRAVYQIYPRSFQDSNGDGVGDIPGIISRLDELSVLGIGIIWLSPVYRSPWEDGGYDISDYREINPEFGTMADMERLISEAAARGIRLILDLVINHTSSEHEWFEKSRRREAPYDGYYIWRPAGSGKKPPNNWTSFFAEDCWEYDTLREEYYLHLFAKTQPDLNYRNPLVLKEVEDIMRFWLDKGIYGFRCDVINILFKESLGDGRKKLILTGSEHYLTRPGTLDILSALKKDVLSKYDCFTVGETVFVTPGDARALIEKGGLDMLFSFEHMETDQIIVKWFKRRFRPKRFFEALVKWQSALEWNAVYLENHDQPRSVSRFGDEKRYPVQSAKLLAALLLTLRGTPFIYQGQELGMTNFDFNSMAEIKDIESHNVYRLAKRLGIPAFYRWRMIKLSGRDNARTPMQWSAEKNAGFSGAEPWIGVNKNYVKINYDSQKSDPGSVLSFYRRLLRLRAQSAALKEGSFEPLVISRRVFAYRRALGEESFIIILNFSGRPAKTRLCGELVLSNLVRDGFDRVLSPWEALILKEAQNEHRV